MKHKFWLSILILLFCTACSNSINVISSTARANYLTKMQNWQVQGRVAIRDQNDGHTASITWQQNGDQYHIILSNPLASQTLHVTPENINDTYMYDVPVVQLSYWLKGMPSPLSPVQATTYNNQHQIVNLQQDGWNIDYLSYSAHQPLMLPEKIVATKDDIYIKVILNYWCM